MQARKFLVKWLHWRLESVVSSTIAIYSGWASEILFCHYLCNWIINYFKLGRAFSLNHLAEAEWKTVNIAEEAKQFCN